MSDVLQPRGIRNQNPGNVRYDGTAWEGLADPSSDGTFCRFIDSQHGIRAICKIMLSYRAERITTVQDIISRWAPSSENNTVAYVTAVCNAMGVQRLDQIDVTRPEVMGALVRAIIYQENGVQPYSDDVVAEGLAMAGVVGPAALKAEGETS